MNNMNIGCWLGLMLLLLAFLSGYINILFCFTNIFLCPIKHSLCRLRMMFSFSSESRLEWRSCQPGIKEVFVSLGNMDVVFPTFPF